MGSKSVLEVREGFHREMFHCLMPASEMGLVSKELERVKAPQVSGITSHPAPPQAASLFQEFVTLLPGVAGLPLPSAPKPREPAEKWKELTPWVIPEEIRQQLFK